MSEKKYSPMRLVEALHEELQVPDSTDAHAARKAAATTCEVAIFLTIGCGVTIPSVISVFGDFDTAAGIPERLLVALTNLLMAALVVAFVYVTGCYWRSVFEWRLVHAEALALGEFGPPKTESVPTETGTEDESPDRSESQSQR